MSGKYSPLEVCPDPLPAKLDFCPFFGSSARRGYQVFYVVVAKVSEYSVSLLISSMCLIVGCSTSLSSLLIAIGTQMVHRKSLNYHGITCRPIVFIYYSGLEVFYTTKY